MTDSNLILVADDNETSRYSKVRTLRRAGYEVIEAENGTQALALVAERQPRLVLLDVQMPDIDGWEVCRRLKADSRTSSVLVLQVSATHVHEEDTVRALEGGADASLTEPLDATVLIATVKALLRARQAEDALRVALATEQAARELAESTNRMKDEFLATLSHELRSPLNAILTWVTLLRTGAAGEAKTAQGLEVIERNTRLQVQLIEDLLDVSRIISGKMRLAVAPVDMPGVVEAAVTAIRPAADAKRIRLETTIRAAMPGLRGDSGRLQQVVSNLLSNAVKFTPTGGTVRIAMTTAGTTVEIRVIDTGRGIPPEFLPHIFERFRQADSTSTRAEGGLGLGLALVRHLVDLHGGTVSAESLGTGHGATFTVRLPLIDGTADMPAVADRTTSATSASAPPSLQGKLILVVDDDSDAREAIAEVLRRSGARIISAASVRDALAAVDKQVCDIIVSDIAMPTEDGYALIQAVRALPREQQPRAGSMALTAYAGVEEQRRALAAGFDVYLAKPVDATELVEALQTMLERSALE